MKLTLDLLLKDDDELDFKKAESEYGISESEIYREDFTNKDKVRVIPSGYKVIGCESYCGDTNYTKIVIPEGVEVIAPGAFLECHAEEILLPKSLKLIDRFAFLNATFKKIVIPEGVKVLGARAFSQNVDLEEINLPKSLIAIGEKAFAFCESLKEISIPDGIKKIGKECFIYSGCENNIKYYNSSTYTPSNDLNLEFNLNLELLKNNKENSFLVMLNKMKAELDDYNEKMEDSKSKGSNAQSSVIHEEKTKTETKSKKSKLEIKEESDSNIDKTNKKPIIESNDDIHENDDIINEIYELINKKEFKQASKKCDSLEDCNDKDILISLINDEFTVDEYFQILHNNQNDFFLSLDLIDKIYRHKSNLCKKLRDINDKLCNTKLIELNNKLADLKKDDYEKYASLIFEYIILKKIGLNLDLSEIEEKLDIDSFSLALDGSIQYYALNKKMLFIFARHTIDEDYEDYEENYDETKAAIYVIPLYSIRNFYFEGDYFKLKYNITGNLETIYMPAEGFTEIDGKFLKYLKSESPYCYLSKDPCYDYDNQYEVEKTCLFYIPGDLKNQEDDNIRNFILKFKDRKAFYYCLIYKVYKFQYLNIHHDSLSLYVYDAIAKEGKFKYYNIPTESINKIKISKCELSLLDTIVEITIYYDDNKELEISFDKYVSDSSFEFFKIKLRGIVNSNPFIKVYSYEDYLLESNTSLSDFEKDDKKTNDNPSSSTTSTSKGCYVATCIYGSYDCPNVWRLRRFRDYYLDNCWWGRLFIKLYYKISPTLVKLFGDKKWFRKPVSKILTKLENKLIEKGYEDTRYEDKY